MENVIEIEQVGKKYDITHERGKYVALRDVIAGVFRNPFRFLKSKVRQAVGLEIKEEFWALKDINLTIKKGEVIGIIGPNGAGKSTLLKLLSRITPPTTGKITLRGKIASLLEVGTGFHPELTGRENIFLNGAILGMTKKEIVKKFDDIVEFSGVSQFIDTPVKRYSSGMYVRLAFAVAAHMEPDILVVDEVLAVGDAEFQKKSLGKLNEVSKSEGRTVLFVSHNMSAIQKLCTKTIFLEKGKVKMFGNTQDVIDAYLNEGQLNSVTQYAVDRSKEAQVSQVTILNKDKKPQAKIPISEPFYIEINYEILQPTKNALLSVMFYAGGELLLLSSESDKNAQLFNYAPGLYKTTVFVPAFLFNVGNYYFDIRFHRPALQLIDHKQNINFEILDVDNPKSAIFHGNLGTIASILDYQTTKTK